MRYKVFGNSGLRISELCLGVMTFGESWGWGSSLDQSKKVFDAFVESGGNFFDTANIYTEGESEKYLGQFIKSDRERFVVSTKFGAVTSFEHANGSGNSRKHMITELEKSLKRLDTEYIDIYWVHTWDFLTPVEEVMRGLDDLVTAGKINYIGISNAPAWVVAKANVLSACRGWNRFAGIQVEYNLAKRDIEADFLPMAEDLDLCVTCWSPLAGGLLTGKYGRHSSEAHKDSKRSSLYEGRITEHQFNVSEALTDVAKHTGFTAPQVALAWLRQKNNRIIPVLGARKIEQLQDNLGCLNCVLSDEHVDFLDSISRTLPFYPYDLLDSEDQRQRTYGGFYEKIDRRCR